jgi:hypothetical protein
MNRRGFLASLLGSSAVTAHENALGFWLKEDKTVMSIFISNDTGRASVELPMDEFVEKLRPFFDQHLARNRRLRRRP